MTRDVPFCRFHLFSPSPLHWSYVLCGLPLRVPREALLASSAFVCVERTSVVFVVSVDLSGCLALLLVALAPQSPFRVATLTRSSGKVDPPKSLSLIVARQANLKDDTPPLPLSSQISTLTPTHHSLVLTFDAYTEVRNGIVSLACTFITSEPQQPTKVSSSSELLISRA